METYQFKSLLDQASALSKRYKHISELTGENFNIFRILKLESAEVKTHSAFIAELLNPQGSHGQKDAFLRLFIKLFCFKGSNIDASNCIVEIEKHVGYKNTEGTEGGRIDIVITDQKSKNQIIIENKIYAGDQFGQLLRYSQYAPNADIIYLTLDGKEPDQSSTQTLTKDQHFKCFSYKSDIVNWLGECRKEVAVYPVVRESLTQYINLIKYLTNQTINQMMETELSTLMKSNIAASFAIAGNLHQAKNELFVEFGKDLQRQIKLKGLDATCPINLNLKQNYLGFRISKPEWKHTIICFQFENYDKDLIYGIAAANDPDKFPLPVELRTKLNFLPNNISKPTAWWPWYNKFESPYNDWTKYDAWEAVTSGKMMELFLEKTNYLLKAIEDIDL